MWIDAKEAKSISNTAIEENTAMMRSLIMDGIVSAAKAGKYKVNFGFSYPLTFKWEAIKKYFTAAGYQTSEGISNNTFSFSIMW